MLEGGPRAQPRSVQITKNMELIHKLCFCLHVSSGVVTYSRPSVSVDVPAWMSWLRLDTCYEIQGVLYINALAKYPYVLLLAHSGNPRSRETW